MPDQFTSAPPPETRRDRYGRYMLPDPEKNGNAIPWTRVTTFAKAVSDTYGIAEWEKRMVVKGMATKPALVTSAAAAAITDTSKLNEIAAKAKEAAGGNDAAAIGTAFHSFCEQVDRGETLTCAPDQEPDVLAYRAAMTSHGIEVVPNMIERIVVIPELRIAGQLDRIVHHAGRDLIGDIKTSKNISFAHGDIAIQLALYAHAAAIWNPYTQEYEDMPPVDQDAAIVMNLLVGTGTCSLHAVDIAAGWGMVQHCTAVRDWRKRRDLFSDVPVVTSLPALQARMRAATSRADLSAAWADANASGLADPALLEMGMAKLAEIGG